MARKRTNLIGNTVLIETSWNVKPLNYEDIEALQTVLIETSWNVKYYLGTYSALRDSHVLIETSWNVKSGILINPSGSVSVLIETSWNVKKISISDSKNA